MRSLASAATSAFSRVSSSARRAASAARRAASADSESFSFALRRRATSSRPFSRVSRSAASRSSRRRAFSASRSSRRRAVSAARSASKDARRAFRRRAPPPAAPSPRRARPSAAFVPARSPPSASPTPPRTSARSASRSSISRAVSSACASRSRARSKSRSSSAARFSSSRSASNRRFSASRAVSAASRCSRRRAVSSNRRAFSESRSRNAASLCARRRAVSSSRSRVSFSCSAAISAAQPNRLILQAVRLARRSSVSRAASFSRSAARRLELLGVRAAQPLHLLARRLRLVRGDGQTQALHLLLRRLRLRKRGAGFLHLRLRPLERRARSRVLGRRQVCAELVGDGVAAATRQREGRGAHGGPGVGVAGRAMRGVQLGGHAGREVHQLLLQVVSARAQTRALLILGRETLAELGDDLAVAALEVGQALLRGGRCGDRRGSLRCAPVPDAAHRAADLVQLRLAVRALGGVSARAPTLRRRRPARAAAPPPPAPSPRELNLELREPLLERRGRLAARSSAACFASSSSSSTDAAVAAADSRRRARGWSFSVSANLLLRELGAPLERLGVPRARRRLGERAHGGVLGVLVVSGARDERGVERSVHERGVGRRSWESARISSRGVPLRIRSSTSYVLSAFLVFLSSTRAALARALCSCASARASMPSRCACSATPRSRSLCAASVSSTMQQVLYLALREADRPCARWTWSGTASPQRRRRRTSRFPAGDGVRVGSWVVRRDSSGSRVGCRARGPTRARDDDATT